MLTKCWAGNAALMRKLRSELGRRNAELRSVREEMRAFEEETTRLAATSKREADRLSDKVAILYFSTTASP